MNLTREERHDLQQALDEWRRKLISRAYRAGRNAAYLRGLDLSIWQRHVLVVDL